MERFKNKEVIEISKSEPVTTFKRLTHDMKLPYGSQVLTFELGREYKKDDKIGLMHIAICKLLEPYGYYEFEYFDEQGWPHFITKEELPNLKAGEQSVLMKEAIVNYFLQREFIE